MSSAANLPGMWKVMRRRVVVNHLITLARIDVNRHFNQRRQCVEQRVSHFLRDAMALDGGQLAVDRDMQLPALAMAEPTQRHVMHIQYVGDRARRALDLLDQHRIGSIHHALPHLACRANDDDQDRDANP